ncbi:MAG TPA: sigma-70 family RNA polymerase sigma factor [Capsulimonadaceae bacterium]|nr:sigma-70 family RNA polymerase sigma factor [Capsulimonadaceae bacterium]
MAIVRESEEGIVRRAQEGDREAFGELVSAHQDMASAYGAAILGDFHLGQDAAQDAFIEAYQRLRMLRQPGAFKYWLKLLVRKHCDRATRGEAAEPVLAGLDLEAHSQGGDPVSAMLAKEERRHIEAALNALSEEHRQVVLLFYMGTHSHAEIAEYLGVPAKTVKSRLHSARTQLKRRMLSMAEDTFDSLRPSKDELFKERVLKLIAAMQQGDAAAVGDLLAADASLANASTPREFWTGEVHALHFAVDEGNLDVVKTLVENGADVNDIPKDMGWSPLHLAMGKPEIAGYLISQGASVDIFAACILSDEEKVRELLTENPSLVQSRGPDGATPLHFAPSVAIAALLLSLGADIDTLDEYHGGSPLEWALSGSKPEMVSYLIGKGAKVGFLCACALNKTDQVKEQLAADPSLATMATPERYLLRPGFTATPLHIAARYGAADVVRLLLDAGADVAARGSDGSMATHDAAFMGHLDVVRILIERGAPINDREPRFNATPLGVAQYTGHEKIVEYLRTQGGE